MKYYTIEIDDHLSLTEIRKEDLRDLARHINDQSIFENTLTIPFPYTLKDAVDFLSRTKKFELEHQQQKEWVIRFDDELIGCIGLLYNYGTDSHKSEIGYWLAATYRNQGIMTKVLEAFTLLCYSHLDIFRIEAQVFTANHASVKTLQKAGFEMEGELKSSVLKKGKFLSTFLLAKLKN